MQFPHLESLVLHCLEDLGGAVDVAELAVPGDQTLVGLTVCLHAVLLQ